MSGPHGKTNRGLDVVIRSTASLGLLTATIAPANAAQFAVTNGTTQTAPGPSYTATGSGVTASAVYTANANSILNGTNLALTATLTTSNGAGAQPGGTINLTGGTVTTSGASSGIVGSYGLNASGGTINFNGGSITTSGAIGVAGYTQGGTINLTNVTVQTTAQSVSTSNGPLGSYALNAQAAGHLTVSGGTITTTGKKFGPRGVLKCKASDKDDATVDEQFGRVGKQVIENTGPLNKKRMETVDEEFVGAALDFMERKNKEGAPWFCYVNTTRMHVFTHLKPSSVGKTGHGLYPDGMVELDGYVGQLLDKLEDLGVADNTIVVFTTDNGAEVLSWPDGGATPFRGEKDTNWEGGWRVPCVMRWPGVIEPGRVINDIASLQDFIPTFAAAAGEPDLVAKVKTGYSIGDKNFKVHLDGYNLLPFLSGKEECPRQGFLYWSDDGDLMALRAHQYKIVFSEQRATGLDVWREPLVRMRIPKMFDLRSDPFERGEDSFKFNDWFVEHVPLQYAAQGIVHEWLESFREFPPRHKAASFTVDQIVEALLPKT